MTTYVYICDKCGIRFEIQAATGLTTPATVACTGCGASARRLFLAPTIIFKGDGFYTTDSRRKASQNRNVSD